jgi:protein MpaA
VIAAAGVALALALPGGPASAGPAAPLRGRSVEGRVIKVVIRGSLAAPTRILVVGCIHGNEPAGIGVVRDLRRLTLPPDVALILVPDANPDGRAHDTRQNARGVDLNRNFPYRWRRTTPGIWDYGGRRQLSEPESRFLYQLIRATRPTLSIWFHQALDTVDLSGGSATVERRFARLIHLPIRRLPRYHGSATSWENHTFRNTTSFVVELPGGRLRPARASAIAQAVITMG